jgi:AAHS family benzoate transporter-like MFS transporter
MQPMTSTTERPEPGQRQVNVTQVIDGGKFNLFNLNVAAICFLAIVFDGLDVSLFGTLLPAIMKDMNMGPAEAGLLASIGHIGAVGGAVAFGCAADTIGRKRMLLVGMTIFIVFTAACGLAQSFVDFAIYRFIAGFGLAGIVPIAVALVYEYTPGTRKAMASSVSYMGITVGVLLSAALAIAFLPTAGWRAILIGTFACVFLVPVAMLWLPESMSMMVKKGDNASIRKVLIKADPTFAATSHDTYVLKEAPASKLPLLRMFQDGYARNTVLLGAAMFCLMAIAVTLTTWIAQLMVQRGFSMEAGITFILVFASSNFISTPLAAIYMPVLFISITLIGFVESKLAALICMFFAGFAVMGATCLLLPFAGSLYPMSFRSTAMGAVYAIGRVGPIMGPAVTGVMLAAGLGVPLILTCIAVPSLIALVAFLLTQDVPPQRLIHPDQFSASEPIQA